MNNQKLVSNGIEDKEILHKFIAEATPLLAKEEENKSTLSDIYRRAAKELEKYYEDHSMICARLSRVFPKEQSRLIRKVLDEKYKRGYGIKLVEDTPLDEIEELFTAVQDALGGLSKVNSRILQKIRANPTIQKKILTGAELTIEEKEEYAATQEYRKAILKAFGTMAELKKYIDTIKDMAVDVEIIQDQLDNRLKLDDYKRVIVKLYDLIYRYRAIGKIWHKSAKWIKQIVEDPELEKIIEQAESCPECGFEWAQFFNKANKRVEKGLEPKLPKMFMTPEQFVYPNKIKEKVTEKK